MEGWRDGRDRGGKRTLSPGRMNASKRRRVETETNPNNDGEWEQSVFPSSGLETERKKKRKSAKGGKTLEKRRRV